MHTNLKLRTKLLITFLGLSLIPFAIIGGISSLNSSKALSDLAFNQLKNIRDVKKAQLTSFFDERRANMRILMESVASFRQAAFKKLRTVQEIKKAQTEEYFTKCLSDIMVLSQNSNVLEIATFEPVLDGKGGVKKELYEFYEEQYFGDALKQFKMQYGHDDLLLITEKGDIVYSVGRGSDLGQNILTGDLKDTPLGKCFQSGLKGPSLQDFAPYPPAENQHKAFVGAPIVKFGQTIGVAALRLDKRTINAIVQRRNGMEKTGETYLVGKSEGSTSYRSDRVIKGGKFGESRSGYDIGKALSEQSGTMTKIGSKGVMEISAYDHLDIPGLNWAMISTVSMEDIIAPVLKGEDEDYFAKYIKTYGYEDLLLIHPDGRIFYSIAHAKDYETNILQGEYADSPLSAVVREVLDSRNFGFTDFHPCASCGQSAAFMVQPVINEDRLEVLVALRLSVNPINKIMQERSGMGQSGKSYLIGADKLMRSDCYLDPENYSVSAAFAKPEKRRIDTKASQNALSGKTAHEIITDHRGVQALSAYTPLDIWGAKWALIAEMDSEEAFASVERTRKITVGIMAFFVMVILGFALLFSKYLTHPIRKVIHGLAESAERLTSASAQIARASHSMSEGSSEQASSLEETSASLEEVSAMSQQNADHAGQADILMKETNQMMAQASCAVSELSHAMDEIAASGSETSRIVKSIEEIAFQTRLLSLNAAVEAARAGESGAGFAVVANEVRNLSVRSAGAVENTSELIQKIISRIDEGAEFVANAGNAFANVAEAAVKIEGLTSKIAMASREQSGGIEQVNRTTSEMDQVTQQNAANAQELAAAAAEMKNQSEQMKGFVDELSLISQ